MLNRYLTGWCGYFALADTPSKFKEFDEWIRRRLRMCEWKKWKKPKTRVRKLIGLGVPDCKAREWAIPERNTGESYVVQYYTKPSITLTGVNEG